MYWIAMIVGFLDTLLEQCGRLLVVVWMLFVRCRDGANVRNRRRWQFLKGQDSVLKSR